MIKILHSGDWHLDAPLQGRNQQQAARLREELLKVPDKIASVCKAESCDLVLLSGDLFDGPYTQATYRAVYAALEQMQVPVFIAPGNHDFICPESPYLREFWPENVHIFKKAQVQWVDVPALGLRVCGAGFESMDCQSLLDGLSTEGLAVGVFHGDATQVNSPYNPVTRQQVTRSGLAYLALGHIHKGDAFQAGATLCAWPGCPMGKGWDEQGEKGVLIVRLEETASARFVPLDGPKFYDLTVDAAAGVASALPAVGSDDFYRITLTGEAETLDLEALRAAFPNFPNLELRDKTVKPMDIWAVAGEDSFEGVYFGMLKDALQTADREEREKILLAAKLSRQLLDGQEVAFP